MSAKEVIKILRGGKPVPGKTCIMVFRPTCEVCEKHKAAVDGISRLGNVWAYMCIWCFKSFGYELGTGKAQVILVV